MRVRTPVARTYVPFLFVLFFVVFAWRTVTHFRGGVQRQTSLPALLSGRSIF